MRKGPAVRCCATLLLWFTLSQASETDDIVKGAMTYLDTGHADSALVILQKVHAQKPSHHEVLYGLALAYAQLDSPIARTVAFLDAFASQKPGLIRDPFQIACIYEKAQRYTNAYQYYKEAVRKKGRFPFAQMGFARMQEAMDAPSGKAVDILSEAVLKSPDNDSLYQLFISCAIRNLREDKAIQCLEKIPALQDERQLDLAEFYIVNRYADKATQLLDGVPDSGRAEQACRFFLLKAKMAFARNQDSLGVNDYWRSVALARDTKDFNLFFEDLYYLFKDNEQSLSAKVTGQHELEKFLIQFWQSRDPDFSTRENERIPEHYRRLLSAQRDYRRYKAPDELGLTSRHRQLDDMGIIYVKHGEPDLIVELNSTDMGIVASEMSLKQKKSSMIINTPESLRDAAPPMHRTHHNASWKYEAFYGRPALIFHFSDRKLRGLGWQCLPQPETFEDRWALGGDYVRMEALFKSPAVGRDQTEIKELSKKIQERALKDFELGKSTETSSIKKLEPKFDCLLTVKSFKGPNGRSLAELYYLLQGKDLDLDQQQEPVLRLKLFAAFFDSRWQELLKKEIDKTVALPVSAAEWKRGTAVLMERFLLPPDSIHFEFSMTNALNRDMGACKGTFQLEDFRGSRLKMSDILLSSAIDTSGKATVFRKGNLVYSPHMFAPFRSGDIIGLYLELYNLRLRDHRSSRYQITCYLKSVDEKTGLIDLHRAVRFVNLMGQLAGRSQSSYIKDGTNSNEAVFLNIDIGKVKKGRYELVVVAQDLYGGEVARAVELFVE
jgi:GWxTD domain-containing protein